MDKEQIIKALEKEIPRSIKEESSEVTKSNKDFPFEEMKRLKPLIDELTKILEEQDEFSGTINLMIRSGSGATGFQPMMAAKFLCRRAHKVGAEIAVDNLEKILLTTEADLICIMALRGVHCNEEVQLTEGVKLLPIESLPSSRQKNSLLESSERYDSLAWENASAFNPNFMSSRNIARAALVTTVKLQQVLYDSGDSDNPREQLEIDFIQDVYKTMDEIRLCLTSTGLCYPLEEFNWQQYTDAVLQDAAGGGGKSFGHLEIIPRNQYALGNITEENARPLVEGYFNLPDKFRGRMRIALERLNQAMCRSGVGDRAVDLSVALECLLLGTEKGDNTFKIALRSALVAYSDVEQRMYCRSIIQSMYNIRSNLVHNGIDSNKGEVVKVKGGDRMSARDVVEEATKLTVLIIQNLIKNGEEPDWFNIEISGKSLL